MNSIILIGNICNDLELKKTINTGKSVCSFNLAVRRPFAKDVTDFLPVVCWNKQAENLCAYCHKGSRIAISGMMTTRTYQDKDGNNRTAYEVVANEVEFLEKKTEEQGITNVQETRNFLQSQLHPQSDDGFAPIEIDDDIPF